ncbi:capsular polysaccharide biosynthesis protein [Novosphingobium sp. AP12]|uniref:capsular polysaccharide biosynthesis protein n=1 Tax=Novosphingobium sp. AP12 TaxID=1144305 RepID=UPI000271F592|nr:capsular polysaccharide biosynthesis protein [Novosphingobium sp. AP12]EJL35355.1 CobQ/CobB/MinD/ParA nucleotide binding domain-containing protein [Novosphingobium sp. AP12]
MTDHRKIPVPRQGDNETPGESLFERAAGRFDFSSFASPPIPVSAEAPVRRVPAKPVEAPVAAPIPAPVAAPIAPPVAEAAAPTPPAAPEPAAEPFFSPAVFSGEHLPVDREHLRGQGLIVPEGTVTELLEEFRIVKRQLLLQSADLRRQKAGPMAQRILIGSPHSGEGKTYCALNLALSIAAEKESEVLLVDADFAKPSILSALGLPGGPGLMDALMDETIDVADCVLGTDIPGLWVLPAGDTTSADSEYLSSSRTGRVLDRLTQGAPHRVVIFDSPPALAASPAAELAKYVGQTVVIVRADKTGRGALDDAISLLGACPNVQLLLNAAQFSPSGRRFGTYYGYKG